MTRGWLVALAVALAVAVMGAPGAGARGFQAGLSVGGQVSAPATYTLAQLQALPQVTAQVARPGRAPFTVTGVSLESLVRLSSPVLPGAKNALLRVTVAVEGAGSVAFALGELDPSFGNHPAIVALTANGAPLIAGPRLVVLGDTSDARSLFSVRQIIVGVQNPAPIVAPHIGDLEIEHGGRATVLSAAVLASLPAQTLSVSFGGPKGIQSHTETGPTLRSVLTAAGILYTDPETFVAAVGSDGYVATVTPAEATLGGRPLLISTKEDGAALARPRLITDGDLKGGRYDSDLVDVVVGDGDVALPACVLTQPGCPVSTPTLGDFALGFLAGDHAADLGPAALALQLAFASAHRAPVVESPEVAGLRDFQVATLRTPH